MIACSEGMAFGEKMGIDPKILMNTLSSSTSSCFSITSANPSPGNIPTSPASNDYKDGFPVEAMRKNVAMALECADNTK